MMGHLVDHQFFLVGCNPILRSRKRAVNRHGLYDENGVVEMT